MTPITRLLYNYIKHYDNCSINRIKYISNIRDGYLVQYITNDEKDRASFITQEQYDQYCKNEIRDKKLKSI